MTKVEVIVLLSMLVVSLGRQMHDDGPAHQSTHAHSPHAKGLQALYARSKCDQEPSESRAGEDNAYFKAGQGAGGEATWNYLLTTPFKARHKLAAAEFHDCRHIIEVGARTENINIRHFLTGRPLTVTVVDPAIEAKCEIARIGRTTDAVYRQISAGLEDFHETGFDCLMALGLDCWSDAYVDALVKHARRAKTVVLGRAVGWEPSEQCAQRVETQFKTHTLVYRVLLDFSGNTFEKSEDCVKHGWACPWTNREMSVFSANMTQV